MAEPAAQPPRLDLPDLHGWERGGPAPFVQELTGSAPGPTVLVTAIVHGNEICGAIALDRFLRRQPRPLLRRGRLWVAFVNIEAYRLVRPEAPLRGRMVDADFNRIWEDALLDGPAEGVEFRRARQLRPLVRAADVILDLHSMHADGAPLAICGRDERAADLARRLGVAEAIITDDGHLAGRRMIDYAMAARPAGQPEAIGVLLECGGHRAPGAIDVAAHALDRLLAVLEMVEDAPKVMPGGQLIEITETITVASPQGFRFMIPTTSLGHVARADTVIGYDGGRAVRAPYDDCYVLMPAIDPQPGQTACRLGRAREPARPGS